MRGEADPAMCLLQQGLTSSLAEGSAGCTLTAGPLHMLFALPDTLSKIAGPTPSL